MLPVHHPSLELLLDYAAGSTGEAAGLALATHLALCPECREVVAQFESLGGALLEAIEPAAVPSEALDNLLARLDEPVPVPVPVPDRRSPADDATLGPVPQPLRGYIGQDLETIRWKRVMRGVEQADIAVGRGRTGNVRARLLRIGPGVRVPRHTHAGTEMTLVLAGGFSDGDKQYQRGDFSFCDRETDHSPVADDDGECLCLTVIDAPLRLTGPLMRLLNPFIRF
ncbi:anti-sigma factor [Skermanella aerolata]|uniref:Anti-sigma factor n=1 Tax=Skermanella aerolata TaxID=393310 RepID=A0A512DW61_9PROT|nr:ChrR family anti-sigma-E factor [Skermanella aerolata]KJB95420.1 sensor histidine kinase [Skermanella aerolata KACC 11604]GEO40692.1 anti-sigma factor [Skermanella aerolata]